MMTVKMTKITILFTILMIAVSSCQSAVSGNADLNNVSQYIPISVENADQIALLETIEIDPFAIDLSWMSEDRLAVAFSWGVAIFQIGFAEEPLTTLRYEGITGIDAFDNILAASTYEDTIKLFDIDSGEEIASFSGHTDSISQLRFSSDGRLLVSASFDNTIRIWNIETREPARRLDAHQNAVWDIVISPDDSLLVSVGGDYTIRLWDMDTGDEVGTLPASGGRIALSPDGASLLHTNGLTGEVFLWPIETILEGKKLHQDALFQQGGASNIVFNHDGSLIICGDLDDQVSLFDSDTGERVQRLSGHSSLVTRLALTPEGTLLASYANRQYDTILIWGINK